eukprot:TRINITY_DN4222_c1_g2_i1.p1 TRINITY_DN4222_c1_g2~~TRINITY_DN4222_c1_g2_i1.p1  ORF type:complete len:591 (-),score=93.10 TRINITY_DN4222_c1_g2_i1:287-1951(-)
MSSADDNAPLLPAADSRAVAAKEGDTKCLQCSTLVLCRCCCIFVLVSVVLVLALIPVVLPGIMSLYLGKVWCQFTTFFNLFDSSRAEHLNACSTNFDASLARLPIGANSIPFGYLTLASSDAADRNPADVNFTSVSAYGEVVKEGRKVPAKVYHGEWWRGNELGGIVNNPFFWSGSGIWPQSNALGATSKQHSAIRKHLEKAFALPEDTSWIRKSLKDFLKARAAVGQLTVTTDIQAWFYQVLYKLVFQKSIDFPVAQDFVKVQNSMVKLGTISQLISTPLYGLADSFLGLTSTKDGATRYVTEYLQLVEELWGEELSKLDCSPSPNCSLQLASGLWDGFYSAGGLSVPSGIMSGLAIMFSTSDTNPSPAHTIPKGKELEFFWECIRFIPPVYGFPHWEVSRPVCVSLTAEETQELNKSHGETLACPKPPVDRQTGFPPVNQWIGGHRVVLDLASAQKDPTVWGKGAATEFRVRPLKDYETKSQGFAEMAVDDDVDNGRSNRVCPGKDLALAVGKLWWEEFKVGEWKAEDPDIKIDPEGALVQIASFTLLPKSD